MPMASLTSFSRKNSIPLISRKKTVLAISRTPSRIAAAQKERSAAFIGLTVEATVGFCSGEMKISKMVANKVRFVRNATNVTVVFFIVKMPRIYRHRISVRAKKPEMRVGRSDSTL